MMTMTMRVLRAMKKMIMLSWLLEILKMMLAKMSISTDQDTQTMSWMMQLHTIVRNLGDLIIQDSAVELNLHIKESNLKVTRIRLSKKK